MSRRNLLLLCILAGALVSPAPLRAWQLKDLRLERVPIPPSLHVLKAETAADLNRDGAADTLMLIGDHATIQTGDQKLWQSPPTWEVKQALITDLDHDGIPEMTLLVWRPFKPWPVDTWLPKGGRIENFHDANGKSCHIILIGWKEGSFRELWAGSALAAPVRSFITADLAGNGQYLVTLEGQYDDPPSVPSRQLKVWEWNGFGFTVVNGMRDSSSLMVPVQSDDGRVLILTD